MVLPSNNRRSDSNGGNLYQGMLTLHHYLLLKSYHSFVTLSTTSFSLGVKFFLLNALYHVKVHMKTRESRLQNRNLIYKMGFLEYKRDSRVAIYLLRRFLRRL